MDRVARLAWYLWTPSLFARASFLSRKCGDYHPDGNKPAARVHRARSSRGSAEHLSFQRWQASCDRLCFWECESYCRRTVRKAGKVSEGVSATRHVTDRLGRHVMIRRKSSFRGDDKRAEDCRGYPGHAPHGAKLLSDRFKGGDEVVSQPHLVQKGVGSETLCQSLSVRVSRMSVKTDIASIGTSIAFRRLLVCVKSRPTQLGTCKSNGFAVLARIAGVSTY